MMRTVWIFAVVALLALPAMPQPQTASQAGYNLKIIVEGVNQEGGNIGILLFNSSKGWAEDRNAALKEIVVPAHPGVVNVDVPNLPAGTYAVAIAHDVNKNHKLDRNWIGLPTEQWGMSNNPHSRIRTPSFSSAQFTLNHDMELHVQMQ